MVEGVTHLARLVGASPSGTSSYSSGIGMLLAFSRVSASRSANATIVIVGLEKPEVGKRELPAMCRFAIPCTLQSRSVTPVLGSFDIRVAPI